LGESLRLVLLGPPGAGKGTQGKFVYEQAKIPHISTGDILRKSVADQTSLGQEAGQYITKGELVPDTLVLNMIAQRLSDKDCTNGFILDGFPRTTPQAEGLRKNLEKIDRPLDHVLYVNVPRETTIQRLAGRRTCAKCGALYHQVLSPPVHPSVCDRCKAELFQREDDREETIAARLKVYERQTSPLIEYYQSQGLLREINGVGGVEAIKSCVFQALELEGR
jgi:adenylate kinase